MAHTGEALVIVIAMAKDLTLEVLKQIRDEAKTTNARLAKLEQRQSETEIRLATELIAVATAVRDLRDAVIEDRDLRRTVAAP